MFATRQRTQSTQTVTYPAPSKGWLASGNLGMGDMQAAEVLDNFFPTAQGAEIRGGLELHATLGAQGVRFLPYNVSVGSTLFASTATEVINITSPASATVAPVATLTGLGSGDWVTTQFSTTGGAFFVAVNGTDHAVYFDGTDLDPLVNETVYNLGYDALSAAFTVGDTVTGGTSGASAEILAIAPSSATAGTLKIGAITAGPFQDNEALTDGATGAATSDIPSGTSTSSSITITGVDTDTLSHVWQYQQRLFFIEKGTLSAWYLPADSIGGAATEIFLGSIFSEGGALLFGVTWSMDSGAGLDDKCVFITDQGEAAVYEGTDPSNANTWRLVGVYKVGVPLDKHATVTVGGDVLIVTKDGIVPLSQAVTKELTGLRLSALSYPIEDAWRDAVEDVTATFPITATLWPEQGRLLVGTPEIEDSRNICFVANAGTGAWARYTGWDVRCSAVFQGGLYVSDGSGEVCKAEVGGDDNGTPYTAAWVPKFTDLGTPNRKFVNHVGLVSRSAAAFDFSAQVFRDYEVGSINMPDAIAEPDNSSAWGSGLWGTMVWGAGGKKIGQFKWKSAGGEGFAVAPCVSMTVFQNATPVVEIVNLQVRFEIGSAI